MIQVDNSTVARPRPGAGPKPTVADNLLATHEAMLARMEADVLEFARHPLQSLETMATGMAFPLAHPFVTARWLARDLAADPLEGSIVAAGVATGVAFVGTVVAIGLGVLAAPVTGGASLALAATAAALTTPVALACLAVDGAGVVLHEVRGALAETEADARQEGEDMAGYVEDAALNLASWAVGDAVQARFFESGAKGLGQAVGDVANNTIGLAGIYDMPAGAPVPKASVLANRPVFGSRGGSDRFELSLHARKALGRS